MNRQKNLFCGNVCFSLIAHKEILEDLVDYCFKRGVFSSGPESEITLILQIKISHISKRINVVDDIVKSQSTHLKKELFIGNTVVYIAFNKDYVVFIPQIKDANQGYPYLVYSRKNHACDVIYCENTERLRYFLWSLLKELYITYYEGKGWILCHGSAVALDSENALIFVAEPNSGKSTLLLAFSAYIDDTQPLSDDRILIKDNQIMPVPSVIHCDSRNLSKIQFVRGPGDDFRFDKNRVCENYVEISLLFFRKKITNFYKPYFIKGMVIPHASHTLNTSSKIELVSISHKRSWLEQRYISPKELWRNKYLWERRLNLDVGEYLLGSKALKVSFRPSDSSKALCDKILGSLQYN
jgi:energy-coupling factor transporter ATP-binding protein EcfA2